MSAVWAGAKWGIKDESRMDLSVIDIGPITEDHVDTIVIEKDDIRIELSKRSGEWKVGDRPVDPDKIELIWETFKGMTISGPVSKNKSNFDRFGVGDSDMSVVFRKSDHERRMRIGLRATTFDTTYIRNAEQNEVYVANANLSSLFSTQVDDWRDKTVMRVNPLSVFAVEIENEGDIIRLKKDAEGAWFLVNGDERVKVEQSKVSDMLANLNPLTARAIVGGSGAREFSNRQVRNGVRLYGEDDVLLRQLDLVKEGDYWWARASGDDTVFDLQKYKLANVFVSKDVLIGDNPGESDNAPEGDSQANQ